MGFDITGFKEVNISENFFSGIDKPIEITECGEFNISGNIFADAKEAIVLNNCRGKGSVKRNSAFNVNTLVTVSDSNSQLSLQVQNIESQQISDPISESKKLARKMEIKYKRLIQKLFSLEAENKFLKNHKQVRLIKDVKSNIGTARSHLLLKQLLHKALQ